MKQFTKLISVLGGIVLLFGVFLFAAKGILNNAAGQSCADTSLAGPQAETVSKAVPAPVDDEIVTIDEDAVITEEYKPVERQTIPIGPGTEPTAAQNSTASAAKLLYQAGVTFLQQEENARIARDTLSALQTNTVRIGNKSGTPGSETLSEAFFDFLGTTDDPAYSDCGVTFSNAEGVTHTSSTYSKMDNVMAEHFVTMELSANAMVKTECTEVTTQGEQENVTLSSFVITRQGADGTTTETYSTSKTEPRE